MSEARWLWRPNGLLKFHAGGVRTICRVKLQPEVSQSNPQNARLRDVTQKISLIELPRLLRAEGIETSYATAWRAVVDGKIPATKQGRGWWIDKADLPEVREHFSPVSN